jgi:pimeloyl-ACP methyl ester carboxylesterase
VRVVVHVSPTLLGDDHLLPIIGVLPVPHEIRTRFVEANRQSFETLACGEGDRLALCLHGFPEHAHSWRYQLPLLAEAGYEAWAPNLRGYGRSTQPPRLRDYAIEHLLQDVAGLIDAAGNRPVTLLGHDWGAVIAWYFAMRRLRPLERLVIVNVPHPATMLREMKVNPLQRRKSWYVLFFQLPWLPELAMGRDDGHQLARMMRDTSSHPERFGPDDLKVFAENVGRPAGLTAMVNYYRALLLGGGARRQARIGYPRIDTPTLMLWGEQDMALEKACTYGTDAYVPQLTLRYLPGISHWAQQDDPETVNAMLAAFLAGEPVPHAAGTDALTGDVG